MWEKNYWFCLRLKFTGSDSHVTIQLFRKEISHLNTFYSTMTHYTHQPSHQTNQPFNRSYSAFREYTMNNSSHMNVESTQQLIIWYMMTKKMSKRMSDRRLNLKSRNMKDKDNICILLWTTVKDFPSDSSVIESF